MAVMGTDRLAEGVARRVMAARRGLVRLGIIERLSDQVTRSSLERNAMRAFGIQTLLLILLGIASMSGISVALRDVSDLNGVVRQQRRLIDARIAVIEEGDRLKAYALHPSPATEAAARTAVTQTDERVRLSATAALTSSQENALRTASGITASGPADFERLVRAQNALGQIVRDQIYVEGNAIQRSLDGFARKATASSEAGAADKAREASAAYSLVRIAIERFVAQSSPVNAAAARDATLSLEEVLNQLYDSTRNPALLGQADQIIKRLIRYDDAFRTITALTGRRDRLLAGFARRQQMVGDTVNSVGGAVDSVQGGAVTNARLALGGLFTLSIVLGVMGIASIYIAGLVFRRAVTRPVQRITAQMQRLAKGDLSEQAAFTDRADEVGEMARALEVFRLNAIEVKRLQGEEVERLAARQDADRRAEDERQRLRDEAEDAKRRMLADLAARFENQVARAMDTLSQAAREIDEGARAVALTVSSSQDSARAVTAAAIEASGSTATIAAATEEMNLSLAEVSRQVSETSSFAARAVERVGQTDGIVTTLAHDAAEIGQVVSLVHDIAQQVNLLALNATIEASRAGAAGRGFAVVAAEVKSLAQQTAMATTEIHDRVSSIQNISRSAMQAMDEIRHVIAEMGVLAASVAAAIEQQVHTTAEIARNTTLAAVGTNRVTDDLRRVHEGVAVSGEAAHSARAAAEAVSRQTAALQLEVDAFLQSVRSA